jgi:carbamate kinase
VDFGRPTQRWLGTVTVSQLRELAGEGHFARGSMGPKVEAVLRFTERGQRRAAIAALGALMGAVRGDAGTQVVSDWEAA